MKKTVSRKDAKKEKDAKAVHDIEKLISVTVDGLIIPNAFRADLFLEGTLLVEVKAVERALPVHMKQVLTYLRVLDLPVGLLTNFGEALFKTGVQRVFNPLCVSPSS